MSLQDVVQFVVFVAVWYALQFVVLPRLGVPT